MQGKSSQELGDASTVCDRRKATRYHACVAACLALPSDGVARVCVSHDVSRTGGFFLTQVELFPGEIVNLELFLCSDAAHPVVARAHVVRASRRAPPHGFWPCDAALEFELPIDEAEPNFKGISDTQRAWWGDR